MARDYVKDIQAVQQLNDVMRESKDLWEATDGFSTNITSQIAKASKIMSGSGEYSKENLKNSKAQAKAGKNIIGVLNAQNKGSKLGTIAAKAKLKISRMLTFNASQETKDLYKQYDLDQDSKKIKKQKGKLDEKSMKSLAKSAGSILSIFGLTGGIVGLFSQFMKMTATIGKNFGALGMTNEKFKTDMLEAGAAATSLGQSIEDTVAISKDLTDNFGFGRDESVAMAQGIMDTSMALGLSNAEGTKLLGTLMQVAGMSFDTAQNFAKQTALLAQAEGVSPTTVMRDIAGSSEAIAKFTAMTPENLAKAAIQATKLGTTLSTIAGSMESMLDFQSSLNSEIEASIMLGRDVNLQKARELALAGKADEFAVELTKQVGSQAEFERLNVLQRQSLAKALGVSVEQMAKMVNNQDKVRTIGEAIAEQDGLEKMIGSESMDKMAQIVANLKRVGAELVITIGPTVAAIAGGFASVSKWISESVFAIPALITLMGIMAARSMATAYTQLVVAGAISGLGVGGFAAAALAVPVLIAGLASLPSFATLPKDQVANIEKGQAIADPGESIVHTEVLESMNNSPKLDQLGIMGMELRNNNIDTSGMEKQGQVTNTKLDQLLTVMTNQSETQLRMESDSKREAQKIIDGIGGMA